MKNKYHWDEEDIIITRRAVPKSYVLFATRGSDKIFVPEKPKGGDLHGIVSVGGKPRKRIENVAAFMKFGNWEVV